MCTGGAGKRSRRWAGSPPRSVAGSFSRRNETARPCWPGCPSRRRWTSPTSVPGGGASAAAVDGPRAIARSDDRQTAPAERAALARIDRAGLRAGRGRGLRGPGNTPGSDRARAARRRGRRLRAGPARRHAARPRRGSARPDPPDLDDHRAPLHRAVLLPRARARAGALPDRRVDRRDPAPVGAHRRVRATPREGRARVPRSDARAGPADGDDRGPRRLARDPAKALSSSCRRRRGGAAVTDFFFARSQMALSLAFHIVFAAIGIGMPLLMAIAEGLYLRRGEAIYLDLAKRWARGTAILFAVGAVSGTVLSFELGLLWPRFMEYAGGIIGMPFSLEGFAFFTEAIFLGIYLYGWDRTPPLMHWISGIIVAGSGMLSGVFVVTVNAWMNAPTGFELTDGRVTSIDPIAAMLNPASLQQVIHMTLAAYVATGFIVAAVHAFFLLRDRRNVFHRRGVGPPPPLPAPRGPVSIVRWGKHGPSGPHPHAGQL